MDSEKRLVFFKEKIKSKLGEIKDDITDIRYKLFISLVDTCNSYEELREMAELDMQLDMFEYTRNEINPKLVKLNMGIDELRESKDNSMRTDKSIERSNFDINIKDNGPVETYTAEEMLEDLDDPEIDAAMAAILLNRVLTEPMEETYRTGMLDSLNEVTPSIEDLDDISDEDMEELGELGDSVALNDDDFDIDESDIGDEDDEEDGTGNDTDGDVGGTGGGVRDGESNLFDDFADINTDVKTQIKDLDDNIFADDTEGLVADDIESDEDEEAEGDIFDDTDDEDLENGIEDDESDDIDGIAFDDSGLFADDEEDEESESADDISFDDSDLFGDDTDEDDEDDEESDLDIDSLEDADFGDLDDTFDNEDTSDKKTEDAFGDLDEDDFGDLDDTFENEEEENASFDGLENAGDIFDSLDDSDLEDEVDDEEASETKDSLEELEEDDFGDLLSDEDDEDNEDEADPFDDLDGLEGFAEEEDSIQIEDDEDDFFSKNTSKQTSNQEKPTRKIEPKTVFSNGTDRGQKTQDMFTSITKIGSLFGKLGAQATIQTKKAVQTTKSKASTSSFFSLADNEDEIDGF